MEALTLEDVVFERSPGSARNLRIARALALVCCLVAAGCGGGSTASKGTTGKPIPGGTLTVAVQSAPNSLDPGTVDAAFSHFTGLAYDPLIYQASDGSLQPDLATSWKFVGSGNRQLDLTLRSGVTFSDGGTLTAAGVKSSLDYASKAPGAQASYLGSVKSIDVTGPMSLSIKLSTDNPMLPNILDQYSGVGQIISPKALTKPKSLSVSSTSAGAGPYVYDPGASVAGDHYTYDASKGYFEPARQHYKKIVLRVIANQQAAANALKTGQVDAVVGGDPSVANQVKAAGLNVTSVPFVWQGLDLLDRDGEVSKPLGDVRVRQAINYAIDRPTVAKAVLGDYGVPTNQVVVQGADGYSAAGATKYNHDPAKAKQLLSEAGYPNGFTLPVLAIKFAGIDTMAEAMQSQLAKVGITVKLTTVTDANTYVAEATSKKFPAMAVGYGAQPIYLEGQGLFLPTAAVFNAFKSSSPMLSSLYEQAAAAAPAHRADLDRQIQDFLIDNAWFAPVAFSPVLYFSRANLGGLKVSGASPIANPLDWYDTK
jgi:ABC-type transport system substrate-binding protein